MLLGVVEIGMVVVASPINLLIVVILVRKYLGLCDGTVAQTQS